MNILEYIVATTLFLVLSALTLKEISSLQNLTSAESLTYAEYQSFRTVSSWIEEFVRTSNAHRLTFGLTVQKDSQGKTFPQIQLPSSNGNKKVAYKKGSDALTMLEIDPLDSYRVLQSELTSPSLNALGCERYQKSGRTASKKKVFLAFSSNCFFLTSGTEQARKGNSACRDFILSAKAEILISTCEKSEARFIKMIYPVYNHLTLYLSEEGIIRLAQHHGGKVVENQPLESGIANLRFDETTLNGRQSIESRITFLSGNEAVYHTARSLSTTSPVNLLYHYSVTE